MNQQIYQVKRVFFYKANTENKNKIKKFEHFKKKTLFGRIQYLKAASLAQVIMCIIPAKPTMWKRKKKCNKKKKIPECKTGVEVGQYFGKWVSAFFLLCHWNWTCSVDNHQATFSLTSLLWLHKTQIYIITNNYH